MPPTVLITIGRLPKALDLARSFKALGYRVIIAEPFRWHLTGVSNVVSRSYQVTAPAVSRDKFLRELCDIVAKEGVTLVVPVSEEIMHVSFLREHLPSQVKLYAMPSAVLLELHHKFRFIDKCREYGVAAPETEILAADSDSAIAARGDYIVKPIFSCSGRGVLFHHQGQALPQFNARVPTIVQRWVHGNVLSTFSIAHEGRLQTTVVYRGVVMSGTVAVAFERLTEADSQHRAVMAWVEKFVSAAKFSGFISFDLVADADGTVYGIECNPRATSGLHFVDLRDLARAVVSPSDAAPIRFRGGRETVLQQFYPCLTEVQKSMFTEKFGANLRAFIRAKDVTWSWRDPLPLWTMPLTASQIIWLSIQKGVTFGEVATLDVGWYGGDVGDVG
jgi:predicted ATP-grasp superfamily ATP-dependent carboligase